MRRRLLLASALSALLSVDVHAFCGFYVAKADTKLFNKASQVALVRDGEKTVMTMANDFQGDLKEFAMVIPVPTVIQKEQVRVSEKALLDHLDAYSAPRLVEYFDEDPCRPRELDRMVQMAAPAAGAPPPRSKSLGVTVEAQYTVGEYDILILSATQSDGLETWLKENGYRLPAGAGPVLGSYIKQDMKFFVARVNLKEQAKTGFTYLRPLQVSYSHPRFMLPIRLGTVNADGPQELFVFALTRRGRVEATNYRTVRLPTGMDVPAFVKQEFGAFYKAMFADQVRREQMRVLFLEYAWDMRWCDPCAADPLSSDELRRLGVSWLPGEAQVTPPSQGVTRRPMPAPPGQPVDVFLTRLHVRYDSQHFPEDLAFQETADRENFQGRYVLRHPWTGSASCSAADAYRKELATRREREAQSLASLTGWDIGEIRRKAGAPVKITSAGPVR
ncbi:MAG TPA: DUF2330 domain-containing protein [Vicinamibacteria bacterium]|nr:DUF2330 domain-containing protein [Vicinamibacteria bacterium]